MFDKINTAFQFHGETLRLRQDRQSVIANNIANADTPNFKARDFDFTRQLKAAVARGDSATGDRSLETTAPGHIAIGRTVTDSTPRLEYRVAAQPSLDGNTVEMDQERAQFMDNSVRYQASLVMVNSYIQGLKTAMQSE